MEPDSSPPIQLLIFALILLASWIWSIVKKADAWIQMNRRPRDRRETQPGEPVAQFPQRSAEAPGSPAAPPPPRRAMDVLRELERALSGIEEPEREAQRSEEQARPEPPTPARETPPLSLPASRPPRRERPDRTPEECFEPARAQHRPPEAVRGTLRAHREPPKPSARSNAAVRLNAKGERISAAGIRIGGAATVARAQVAHLAVLRNADDLKRAMVLHEILGQPRALQLMRAPETFARRYGGAR